MKLKYVLEKYRFLKIFNSPFKPLRLNFYAGKVSVGTPYFFPRKWVKATPELAHKAALEEIKSEKKYNELNPKSARNIRPYDQIYREKLKYT